MPEIDLGRVLVAVIAAIYCGFFVYTVWLSAHEWVIVSLLAQKGTITDGQITCKRLRNGGKSARCCVTYSYVRANKSDTSLTHEQQVSWRHYRKLVEGAPVKVSYLPFKPHIARLAALDLDNTVRDSSTIVAAIACIVFVPLVVLWLVTYLLEPTIIRKWID